MTTELTGKVCTPCQGGIPPLTREQAAAFLSETGGWQLFDDGHRISRDYQFSDFREALAFVDQVGELAESEGHHPDVAFGWGYATVSLQTKKIKGLHENDFIMAAKINQFADSDATSA